MILLLGATGYIGEAFEAELQERGAQFRTLSRKEIDYSNFDTFLKFLRETKPEFVINAAGYTGTPNVDACETAWAETLAGNTLLPMTVAQACAALEIPWGHISSGCIFSGGKILEEGHARVEKNLLTPEIRALIEKNHDALHGFSEVDEPNFTFRNPPCSFYSGTKALAEESLRAVGKGYIWRLRIPFDELDNRRNYLSKIQNYPKVYDNVNSLSHRRDFVRACLDLWKLRAPFGIYNVVNPGYVTTQQVVKTIQEILQTSRVFEFWASDEEFYKLAARTPRSNCVLDVSKLLAAGIKMRPVEVALREALEHWKPA